MTTITAILLHKIVAILRGVQPADVPAIALALHHGGVRCMEITLNSPGALQAIEAISNTMKDRMFVGAGTVLSATEAADAISAGAQFIISPIMDEAIISKTKELGAVSIPGAFTPTEIFRAWSLGGDIIKVFPGTSGAGFIKEILAPLPQIPLMPTGGISLQNLQDFKSAGAVAFGIGKALVDAKQKLSDTYLEQLTANASAFMAASNG